MSGKQSTRKLQQFQLDKLNKDLQNYKNLAPQAQAKVRKDVIQQVKSQRDEFKAKLTESHAELKNLNLILGATGAGKSTLFNYLNSLPLVIREGVDKNGKKNQTIRLDVDTSKIAQGTKIAPIGHGFVSQTTIPNFSKSKYSDVTYVDCAGQFDSRDILQSIINSYFKYQLAVEAKQVKLSIAINYTDIRANRGTIFKQILKQVGNFIGLWDEFQKHRSISLVITGADPHVKDVRDQVTQMVKEIAQVVKDLGPFKTILADIALRGAIAIFLAPKKKYNPDTEQFYISDGETYKPNPEVGSIEVISKILQQTKFMPSQPGLFVHNLQHNAQFIVNVLCEGIISQIKTEVMSVIVINIFTNKQDSRGAKMKKITKDQMNAQKMFIQQKISKLSGVKDISEIIKIFQIKSQLLYKYNSLSQDLQQFLKISNIPNIKEKIAEVSKDIIIFLKEKVMKIDESTIQYINDKCQQSIQKNKELEQQLKSKKYQAEAELRKLELQADIQKQKNQRILEEKRIDAQNQKQTKANELKMNNKLQIQKMKVQKQKIKSQRQHQAKTQQDKKEIRKLEIQSKERMYLAEQAGKQRQHKQKMQGIKNKQKLQQQQMKIDNQTGNKIIHGIGKVVEIFVNPIGALTNLGKSK